MDGVDGERGERGAPGPPIKVVSSESASIYKQLHS